MSYSRVEEKDTVIFLTKDDYNQLPTLQQQLEKESPSSSSKPESSGNPNDAYNPETNEINWDCPCIAPMIKPPCGDTFKAAFSCFVYSTAEPKGFDCVDQFREMQKCFREHPDIYGEEIDDDDGADEVEGVEGQAQASTGDEQKQHKEGEEASSGAQVPSVDVVDTKA
ncbi:hypothetical protein SmJEL517_g05126 [Synchytrium microbalum]|uniref:Mitochondrial intermembrane space import and assembly protein 40 n=1 Tax=Synchytrium microbalum TaxID=1806994 RepID=A0A507C238_9FUNG|nr:uncharacterized protein SmJEL517_g05126 [Synchytrium microbalum]TPX31595.1 hypothetical protein SmJEL517_g05126 [Synchytrium microbalum]